MKHKIKRLLSLLLSLTMLTAALPTSIWAEETGFAQATGAEAELPNEPKETAEPELPVESPEATDEFGSCHERKTKKDQRKRGDTASEIDRKNERKRILICFGSN